MTMTALNYAQDYQRALANAYGDVLHFGALHNIENDSRYKWLNANTIQIPTMSTTGCVDANRDSISFAQRNYTNAWTAKTLSFERKWSTLVHPRDIEETNMVTTITNITKTFNETQKFFEKDAYLVSKLYADYTTLVTAGKADAVDTTTLEDGDDVLELFDNFMMQMDEANVPLTGRKFYCTYAVKTMLKNAASLKRIWDTQSAADGLNRKVEYLDGVEIIGVPSKVMKTLYNFTSGCVVGTGAKQINVFMVHPDAIITPETYEYAKLDEPSAGSEGKYVYYEERHEDAFILDAKVGAIKFNITNGSVSA